MKKSENYLYITFPALTENERISRMIGAAFIAEMNPTVEELDDVKTAISEAVTNAIIHGYEETEMVGASILEDNGQSLALNNRAIEWEKKACMIEMTCIKADQEVTFIIEDRGRGIENVKQAMEPLFTTKSQEERSGMGFSFMEAFMDKVEVESEPGKGTKVTLKKKIGYQKQIEKKGNMEKRAE